MKRFRRVPVYKEPGKTNVSELVDRSGVYLIYEDRKLVYIGHSTTNMYKTLLRHFQRWDDPAQIRITYPQTKTYRVSIVYTTAQQAPRLEFALIKRYQPRDNPDKYENQKAQGADIRALHTFLDTPVDQIAPF